MSPEVQPFGKDIIALKKLLTTKVVSESGQEVT
jgi:hypothetical protein